MMMSMCVFFLMSHTFGPGINPLPFPLVCPLNCVFNYIQCGGNRTVGLLQCTCSCRWPRVCCDLRSLLLQCSSFLYIRNRTNCSKSFTLAGIVTMLMFQSEYQCFCVTLWHWHCRVFKAPPPLQLPMLEKQKEYICIVRCLSSQWHPPAGECDVMYVPSVTCRSTWR